MTDRYLVVGADDPVERLATAIQVVMDLYIRVQRDVVLVSNDPEAARQAVGRLIGPDAAAQLVEAPQAFAQHTIRIVSDETTDGLSDELVVAHAADDPMLERLDQQSGLTAVVAAPSDEEAATAWAARHHPLEVAPRTGETAE